MSKLVIATHNRDKLKEFEALLAGLEVELLTLEAFPDVGEIEEDAATLEGNALKKARVVAGKAGLPSVADDTGLEVYYLNDAPGVFSSRFSGPGATYASNCAKLLDHLKGVPPRRRGARFRCVLAFVAPGAPERTVEGVCPGVITEFPRGGKGFGYDPVFFPDGYNETFGEMDPVLKNKISHRGQAMEAMKAILLSFFGSHR